MKNHDQKLKILDLFNEKILNRATEERYRLMQESRRAAKKKWIPILAASLSAAVLLSVVAIFLVPLLLKQVPVYTGMTVSNQSPFEVAYAGDAQYEQLAATGRFEGDHDGAEKKPNSPNLKDTVRDTLQVEGAAKMLYYANPNEDIYVTVHIDNPDQYEILSFTLNGKKYSSYMLEEGSDMENLILKVNVGDVEGIVEYTIDAIKYVDGTEIKDVKMEGDQTVRIGVQYKQGVSALVENESISYDSIGFTASVTDQHKLIEESTGKLQAVLYLENELIAIKELSLTAPTEVVFDSLHPNTEYQYAVVAHCDALDGKGFDAHILYENAVYTTAVVLFSEMEVAQTEFSFKLAWGKDVEQKTLDALVLYKGDERVRELDPNATQITDLLSNTSYRLVAEYSWAGEKEEIVLGFATPAKIPQVSVKRMGLSTEAIQFEIEVCDDDRVATIHSVSLNRGQSLIATSEYKPIVEFFEIDSTVDYTVKIDYSYDLNDGAGVQTPSFTTRISEIPKWLTSSFDNDGNGEQDIFCFTSYIPYDFTTDKVIKINAADYDRETSIGVGYFTDSGLAHYYLDLYQGELTTEQLAKNKDMIINWKINIPEDGYYAMCIQMRMKNGTQRGNILLVDGKEMCKMDFQFPDDQLTWLRDNATDKNAWMTGFGVELSKGKHTISFKGVPSLDKTFHFRYIYLVKAS